MPEASTSSVPGYPTSVHAAVDKSRNPKVASRVPAAPVEPTRLNESTFTEHVVRLDAPAEVVEVAAAVVPEAGTVVEPTAEVVLDAPVVEGGDVFA
jgi:hypothetical protein